MIIYLKGADFSSNNIGTLTSWAVTYNLTNVTSSNTATTIERNASFETTILYDESLIGEVNENDLIEISMDGVVLDNSEVVIFDSDNWASDHADFSTENIIYKGFKISIAEVTGPLVITVKKYASDEVVEAENLIDMTSPTSQPACWTYDETTNVYTMTNSEYSNLRFEAELEEGKTYEYSANVQSLTGTLAMSIRDASGTTLQTTNIAENQAPITGIITYTATYTGVHRFQMSGTSSPNSATISDIKVVES